MKCTLTETKHGNIVFYGVSCKMRGKILSFDDISTDYTAVRAFCDMLERGNVTELTLSDIVDDFVNA